MRPRSRGSAGWRSAGWGLLLAAACSGETTDHRTEHPAAGALDSAIAASKLPGSAGVRRAMEASDSARARRALEDTGQ